MTMVLREPHSIADDPSTQRARDFPNDLPAMVELAGGLAPAVPLDVAATQMERQVLLDLALKAAYTVPRFNTGWAAGLLHLTLPVTGELLEQLRAEHLLEVLGRAGPLGYSYAITQRGRERAGRLMEVCGYVGPAPVSLIAYTALTEWQLACLLPPTAAEVAEALAELVLSPTAAEVAGLAAASSRSLFVFGAPGNGKTTIGRLLHNALSGDVWIPHAIAVDHSVIRLYDAQVHQPVDSSPPCGIDARWVRVHRPLVVLGGETTLETFDLTYSPSLHYYEAPLHMKANGGTLLIDDLGRQKVEPHRLLNRWIIPLEHQFDYLTFRTGQKIQVPVRQLMVVATNLDPATVTDPAFLRRIGYRLALEAPTPQRYLEIFRRYAARVGLTVRPELLEWLLAHYRTQHRELRCCEPRDLIERVRDICHFRKQSPRLDEEHLSLAWTGYFGDAEPKAVARTPSGLPPTDYTLPRRE